AFRDSIRNDLALAARLAARVDATPALERLAPVALSAVCFRHVPPGARRSDEELDAHNERILHRVARERRRVYLSNATVRGRFALRACIVNHRAAPADVDAIVDETLAAAR